jgi:hypothetical protein
MKIALLALVALTLTLVLPSTAQQWHWFTPQAGFSDGDFDAEPGTPTTAVRIFPTGTGSRWYWIPLPGLPQGAVIDSLTVCHDLINQDTYITQIRLTQISDPDVSPVIHDDPTDYTLQGGRCESQAATTSVPIAGAVHLGIRFDVASPAHFIEIGGIGIKLAPSPTPVNDQLPGAGASLLEQNRPNPFNPATTIAFDLERSQPVTLEVYTVDGMHVVTLRDERLSAGSHTVTWNGRDDVGREMASGVYLYRLQAGDRVQTRRMALIR